MKNKFVKFISFICIITTILTVIGQGSYVLAKDNFNKNDIVINFDDKTNVVSVSNIPLEDIYDDLEGKKIPNWITIRVFRKQTNGEIDYLVTQKELGEDEDSVSFKLESLPTIPDITATVQVNINGKYDLESTITIKDSKGIDDEDKDDDKYKNKLDFVVDPGDRSRDRITQEIGFNEDETVRVVSDRAIVEIKNKYKDDDVSLSFDRNGNLTSYKIGRETYKNDTKTGYKWILTVDRREPKEDPRREKLDDRVRDITWTYEKDDKKKEDDKKEETPEKEIAENPLDQKPGIDEDGNLVGNLFDMESNTPYINGYKDQTFRPGSNAKREEVASMVYKVIDKNMINKFKTTDNAFTDVPSHKWSLEFISTLSKMELINGYKDGTFRPENSITRAETVAIVARATGVEEKSGAVFSDTSGHWAENLVNGVAEMGWLNGYQDGTFRPNEPITRAELVTVLNNALSRPKKVGSSNRFTDVSSFNWYYEEVMKAASF